MKKITSNKNGKQLKNNRLRDAAGGFIHDNFEAGEYQVINDITGEVIRTFSKGTDSSSRRDAKRNAELYAEKIGARKASISWSALRHLRGRYEIEGP